MNPFIEWVLKQFVSGWDVFVIVLAWAANNPVAAAFWAGVWASILNYVVKITPTRLDDSLLDAITRALIEGMNKADVVKNGKK